MTTDLATLTWPRAALGAALVELTRALGMKLRASGAESAAPPSAHHLDPDCDEPLADWLRAAAARAGLHVQHTECGYSELRATLSGLGPAIVRVRIGDQPRYFAVLASNARESIVLSPEAKRVAVPHAAFSALLTLQMRREASVPVDAWLRALAVPRRRIRRARERLFESILEERRLAAFYLVRPDPGVPFIEQLRARGILRLAAVACALSVVQVALSLLGWVLLGRTALAGQAELGWMSAWILTQLSAVPLQLGVVWLGGSLLAETAICLKQRLLAGALRIDADQIRTRGSGRLLAMVFESEALEVAGLAGAFGLALSGVQLASAIFVLWKGACGATQVLLLLGWCGFILSLSLRYFRRRREWTTERFALARAFVENVVGNRTRVVQQPERRWHLLEDQKLAAHLGTSEQMDRAQTRLMVLPARGWLVVGIAGLIPMLVTANYDATELIVAVGGILQAHGALAALSAGAGTIASAGVAWQQVHELFHAAVRVGHPGSAAIALAAPTNRAQRELGAVEPAATSTSPPTLDARGLSFRYPAQREPVLAGCDLTLFTGDRVLLEGASGSGKSTLAALLTGLREPDSGHIAISGLDRVSMGDAGWRKRVTSAPQFHENHILSASLAFNLLMGRAWPAAEADLDKAARVCASLGLDELIRRMPSGLHQVIGETGWQLSHGERSRLFLARALLQDTEVLIVDESFGALDPETLRRCVAAVLERARTLVVIAHP